MAGTIVSCTHLDEVRVEVLGGSRAVRLPAEFVLAMYDVLKASALGPHVLTVEPLRESDEPAEEWEAWLDDEHHTTGSGANPWAAVKDLADKIEARR